MVEFKKYLLTGLTLATPIVLATSCHSAQTAVEENQQNKQVQEVHHIYANNTVNGHLFEFKKVDAKALILSIEANDYYLTPQEVNNPGSLILKNGLTLKWDKPLTSQSKIDDFTIFNDEASTYINYVRVFKPRRTSSFLHVRINNKIENFYFFSKYDLEETIIMYLNYWTKYNSAFWQLDSLGNTDLGRKEILNKLIKPSGFKVRRLYGTITNGTFTITGIRL